MARVDDNWAVVPMSERAIVCRGLRVGLGWPMCCRREFVGIDAATVEVSERDGVVRN